MLANIAQMVTVNFVTAPLFVGMSLAQVVQERAPCWGMVLSVVVDWLVWFLARLMHGAGEGSRLEEELVFLLRR